MSRPRVSFLILLALAERPRHGLGIVEHIEDVTRGRTKLGPGALYGTLQKLQDAGLIRLTATAPDPADDDPRRRYYRITASGARRLREEASEIRLLSEAAARHAGSDA
jgi:DNA-binding PadR family transcriptional regulator